jgi:hypothetical protein
VLIRRVSSSLFLASPDDFKGALAVVLVTLALGVAGCGGRVIVDGEAAGGAGGGTLVGGGGPGGGTGGGTCPDHTPPPSQTQPTKPGCYENDGSGWVQVPCSCELWLQNKLPATASVALDFAIMASDVVPSLGGPLDVEIAFADPDGSWDAAWASQTQGKDAFAVTAGGGKTTVRMAANTVSLAPVHLGACRRRDANASVSGVFGAVLEMHATLADAAGNVVATYDGTCEDIPPE